MVSRAEQRAWFAKDRAPSLAEGVCPAATPWSTALALSKYFAWFADDDHLVVVGCPGERQADLDLGLAYGLGHVGDRELVIVLPEGATEPTRRRMPWIDVPIRLYAYGLDDAVEEVMPLSRSQVLATYRDKVVTELHSITEPQSQWVEELIGWAGSQQFDVAHRPSYLAWHVQGRMVLRIKRSADGLLVTAGVHGSSDADRALELPLTCPPTPAQLAEVQQAALAAAETKRSGLDTANAEHELQDVLAKCCGEIGLAHMVREFPAFRPVERRAYIDFLAVGTDRNLHVVETKIGPDPMLALQGLDYWIWATAHRDELIEHFVNDPGANLSADAAVLIDFVVAEKSGRTVSPYTAAQVEAFAGAIGWRFHTIGDWKPGPAKVTSTRRRQSPTEDRACPPRYAVALERHLVEHHAGALSRRVFFTTKGDGINPSAKQAYEELDSRRLLHRFIDHVRSSQAFALNLFTGLDTPALEELWRAIDPLVTEHTDIEFEYCDPRDALGELQATRPHQTQVDVLLRGRTSQGIPRVALIEVKLSEVEFGSCSAFAAAANDTLACCATPGPWGNDTKRCFQLRNHGTSEPRRYNQFLRPEWVTPLDRAGCSFRVLNQPMRNVALARSLIEDGDAEAATFCLCAPAGNTNVWRQWREANALFGAVPDVSLVSLPAERVAQLHAPSERSNLLGRYQLNEDTGR